MLAQDHLALRLIRLKSPERWSNTGEGFVFVFPKGGAGNYVFGDSVQRLAAGDVLVLNAAFGGRLDVSDGGELLCWLFSLKMEHLFPLFGCNEISRLDAVTNSFKTHKLYPAFVPLASECHKLITEVPTRFDLTHRSQLLRIVAAILTAEFKNVRPQREGFIRVDDHMSRVFENLSFNEVLNLSVDELAGKFSCSRRHLNRLFHKYLGVSVSAMRMEMRLLKAISLLRDQDTKIINVAGQCGFNHLGLFNTCFKRRFGTTPGQWRKMGRQPQVPHPVRVASDPGCALQRQGLCHLITPGRAARAAGGPGNGESSRARELTNLEGGPRFYAG